MKKRINHAWAINGSSLLTFGAAWAIWIWVRPDSNKDYSLLHSDDRQSFIPCGSAVSEVMEKCSIHLFTLATLPSFWKSLMQQKRLVHAFHVLYFFFFFPFSILQRMPVSKVDVQRWSWLESSFALLLCDWTLARKTTAFGNQKLQCWWRHKHHLARVWKKSEITESRQPSIHKAQGREQNTPQTLTFKYYCIYLLALCSQAHLPRHVHAHKNIQT